MLGENSVSVHIKDFHSDKISSVRLFELLVESGMSELDAEECVNLVRTTHKLFLPKINLINGANQAKSQDED